MQDGRAWTNNRRYPRWPARVRQRRRISEAAAVDQVRGCRSRTELVVPDLEAGNMLAKNLIFLAKADAAGIVLGARVPIVLTSRANSVRARLASCAAAVLYADARVVLRRCQRPECHGYDPRWLSEPCPRQVPDLALRAGRHLVKGQIDGIGTRPRLLAKGTTVIADRSESMEQGQRPQRLPWWRLGSGDQSFNLIAVGRGSSTAGRRH